MKTVDDLADWMKQFAPLELAESWDNVGLLLGDPASTVTRVMTCLTVMPGVVDEAIVEGANMIVSHHPILFRPTQKITADRPESAMLWRLARANIAVYSPHTAFDNCEGGINDGLAGRLGLADVMPLRPAKLGQAFKVVVFAPASDRDRVTDAAFAAGAGCIGSYEQCSFTTGGRGTFFGTEGTNPAVGRPGCRETVREWKVEFVCETRRLDDVTAAIRDAHSYEEPAIDILPVQFPARLPGVGRVGNLSRSTTLGAFAVAVGVALRCVAVGFAGDPARVVTRVAICCGAGDDFLEDADRAGADVLLTGEAKYHRALEAETRGLGLVVAGHHATERPGVEELADRIDAEFSHVQAWASQRERDPITWSDSKNPR